MKLKPIIFILITVFFYCCEKAEKPIKPYDRGNVTNSVAPMGNNYENHVFFNLDSNKVVKTISKNDWDIAFDCSDLKHIIHPNNGRGVYVAKTNKLNFTEVNDTIGLKFYWGQPSLNIDSLAFGKWWLENPKIFVINLGVDELGMPLGFVKCKPELINNKTLKLLWCKLNETTPTVETIEKNADYNFVYYSFLNKKQVDIEPRKNEWDLFFTQYVKMIFSTDLKISQDYQLAGVLINPSRISVATDYKTPFTEINGSKLDSYIFSNVSDAIGYEWKIYSFSTNSYVVLPEINYIISQKNGFFYKLHFIDFYNDLGIKGYPKFEFQKI
ncbi:MAG: HmuY family protein [Bacteroidetes bacterium]|nr:HmuY family protein [Bacteroidota bacterium]